MSPSVCLTRAQRAALHVLAEQHPAYVRGGKRGSALTPVPAVNTRAADSLCQAGLAKLSIIPWASVFTSAYEYKATAAGLEVVAAWDAAGSL